MSAIQDIESNITKFGSHIYLVTGGKAPRYFYTIGNHSRLGFELIFAGGTYFSGEEVCEILNELTRNLLDGLNSTDDFVTVGEFGSFRLAAVERSWADDMVLGALDYYQLDSLECFQVLPQKEYWTVDIPDLSRSLDVIEQPVWKWFHEEWSFPVSATSIATTNLDALRGFMVTEAVRWEPDLWELFSGSGADVSFEEMRCVPLATLIAFDPSLEIVTNLSIAEGLWRDGRENVWRGWDRKSG